MKHIVGICSLCLLLAAWTGQAARSCDNWNTKEFFQDRHAEGRDRLPASRGGPQGAG